MATAASHGPFTTKSHDVLVAETGETGRSLRRVVGALDLTALGVGAVIDTGIFVIIGEAIGKSGPAIVLSFVLAGVTCVFSALSYAEMASTIPVAGSAYTYSYATMGELVAWIIGWDLILEYGISVAAVAVGWGAYLQSLLASLFGIHLSDSIAQPPGEGGTVNRPAAFLVLAVAALLIAGVRKTTRANTVMVITKIVILFFFIVVAFSAFHSDNLTPFAPHGFGGIRSAAALIFFAYIGFDAVSTAGEETRRPGRDLPVAIVGSLLICTVLYILVALAATGAYRAAKLSGDAAPLTTVLTKGVGICWAGDLLSFGALIAITSVVLTVLYGQTRIIVAMCRDGLLPAGFAAVSERTGPGARRLGRGRDRQRAVHLPDDPAPRCDLGAVLRVDGRGARDLRRLRLPPFAPAHRRARGRRARAGRAVAELRPRAAPPANCASRESV
jgi:basic amino acid/polyamine antiporter, APA family